MLLFVLQFNVDVGLNPTNSIEKTRIHWRLIHYEHGDVSQRRPKKVILSDGNAEKFA